MITVKILEQHSVPLYTTSIHSYADKLEEALNQLSKKYGPCLAIVERSIGRSTYHLAVFDSSNQSEDVEKPESVEEAPKRSTRSKAKSAQK